MSLIRTTITLFFFLYVTFALPGKKGHCAMLGICDPSSDIHNCVNFTTAVQPSFDVFSVCPSLAGGPLCCDQTQFNDLANQINQASGILGRCPACLANFREFWCQYTCSPDQSVFVEVKETKIGSIGLPVVNHTLYRLSQEWSDKFWTSCVDVTFGATGMPVIPTFFGGAKNPLEWFTFMGIPVSAGGAAPFLITFAETVSGSVSDTSILTDCNTPDFSLICSCTDCKASCPADDHGGGIDTYTALKESPPITIYILGSEITLDVFILLLLYILFLWAFLFIALKNPDLICCLPKNNPNGLAPRIDETESNNNFVYRQFYKLGSTVGRHPYTTLLITALVITLCGIGMINFTLEKDPIHLWVSPSSTILKQRETFGALFTPFYRVQQVILSHEKDVDKTKFPDIFFPEVVLGLKALEERIESISVVHNNKPVVWEDLCYRAAGPNKGCIRQSVTEYFVKQKIPLSSNSTREYIRGVVSNCALDSTGRPCMGSIGVPSFPYVVLGGYEGTNFTDSQALILTLLLNNEPYDTARSKVWEAEALRIIESTKIPGIKISFSSERSIEDELDRESSTNIPTVALSYIVMFFYISLAMSNFNPFNMNVLTRTRFSLGLGAIIVVSLSLVVAMGICSMFSVTATLIIGEVIPFLVLAIGIDNVFIILNAFESKNPNLSIEKRLAETLAEAGTSITLSSLSEAFAFFLGVLTRMPAVQAFAIYAGVAILANFLLQITCFSAILVLDTRRKEKNRVDCIPCVIVGSSSEEIQDEEYEVTTDHHALFASVLQHKLNWLQSITKRYFVPIIANTMVKVACLLFFTALCFVCISSARNGLTMGLDQRVALPRDSYLQDYFDDLFKYGKASVPMYFVIQGESPLGPWESLDGMNALCSLPHCSDFSIINTIGSASKHPKESYISSRSNTWIDDYIQWLTKNLDCCRHYVSDGSFCPPADQGGPPSTSDLCKPCLHDPASQTLLNGTRPTAEYFKQYIRTFLYNSSCSPGCTFCGTPYYNDLDLSEEDEIISARFMTYHTKLDGQAAYIAALRSANALSDKIESDLNIPVFPYSVFYVFFEQYLYIENVAIMNCLLSSAAIFILCLLLLRNAFVAFLSTLTVMMIVVDLLGIMVWWGISLNAISVVNMVMCIGISVEFVTHITVRFMRVYGTRDERIGTAMVQVGASIFSGIFLTKFVGVVVLATAPSAIFEVYFFRMYFSICLLGGAHGFFFMPILLSLIGPPPAPTKRLKWWWCNETCTESEQDGDMRATLLEEKN